MTTSGEPELSIPRSFYFSHHVVSTREGDAILPEKIIVFGPSGDYLYRVVGREKGTYRLYISSTENGSEITFEAIDIPTVSGAVHDYRIDWAALSAGEEGVILDIDADGDGIFERTVIADEDLTSEEFTLQTETVIDFQPDVLNFQSQGKFVTVYIELPEGFDVRQIDVSSVMFNTSVPALQKPIEIGDYDSDGINDLMVKFAHQQVAEVLEVGEQKIYLAGRLADSTLFAGIDIIRVLGSKDTEIAGEGFDMTLSELADSYFATEILDTEQSVSDSASIDEGDNSAVPEEDVPDQDEDAEVTDEDPADTGDKEAIGVEEAVTFTLSEAAEIINELEPENFTNEDSAIALTNEIYDALAMMDDGLLTEALYVLENDILERTNGCADIGEPDDNDWITTYEGQGEVYPLIVEAIELLESLIQ